MDIKSYKDLVVWQKSRIIVKNVYELCAALPNEELYGISSQIKRAVISIPSNIAEGYRRNSRKEYKQFLGIALGSAAELETQLILVNDLFGTNTEALQLLTEEVEKMLSAIINKLRA